MKPCKEWTGKKTWDGYGVHKEKRVNRLTYCESHGLTLDEIKGFVIRHTCDNRACYEPTHLVMGTQKQNILDMKKRGRTLIGEDRHSAKFTWDQIRKIRARYEPWPRLNGASAMAKEYGVYVETIKNILKNRTWIEKDYRKTLRLKERNENQFKYPKRSERFGFKNRPTPSQDSS